MTVENTLLVHDEGAEANSVVTAPGAMTTITAEGLLFIGDPHVGTVRPDRRRDTDYLGTVLEKMQQANRIAEQRHLQIVCLGDLFHCAAEASGARTSLVLSRLAPVLNAPGQQWWILTGNHDKAERRSLSLGDTLHAIKAMGLARVLDQPGFWGMIRAGNNLAAVGGTPYGYPIPTRVDTGGIPTIWTTHHDLAFGGAHPGSQPIADIDGAFLAVNGHLHPTYAPVQRGSTTWWNPGNITRQSVDQSNHVPSVWEWCPGTARDAAGRVMLVPYALEAASGEDMFDHSGRGMAGSGAAAIPTELSRFVTDLAAEEALPLEGRGAYLADAIHQAESAGRLASPVARYLHDLLRRTQSSV